MINKQRQFVLQRVVFFGHRNYKDLFFHIFDSLLNGKIQIVLMEVLHYESACACESEEDPEPYQLDRNIFLGGDWYL